MRIDNAVYFTPELKLFSLLELCILEIRSEITNNTDYINLLFGNTKLGTQFVYKDQLKKILSGDKNSQRFFTINYGYDKAITRFPSAFLTLASDNQVSFGIGNGEDEEEYIKSSNDYRKVYSNRFSSSQNLFIYSDNSNEVGIIYHFFKALIIALKDILSLTGFENIVIGGQDIVQTSDIVPGAKAYRVLSIKYDYETSGLQFDKELFVKFLNFIQKPIDK